MSRRPTSINLEDYILDFFRKKSIETGLPVSTLIRVLLKKCYNQLISKNEEWEINEDEGKFNDDKKQINKDKNGKPLSFMEFILLNK